MKQTITFCDFRDAFQKIRPENFTYEGQKALFEYLEQLEEDTGEELELDVIALCCDFAEYPDLEEFHAEYNAEEYPDLESIQDCTILIDVPNGGFIIQNF